MYSSPGEIIDRANSLFPNNAAYGFKNKSGEVEFRTFGELYRDINGMSRLLHRHGVAGEKISIWGSTSYSWIVAYFGTMYSGSVVVPIVAELKHDAVLEQLKFANVKMLIYDAQFQKTAEKLREEMGGELILFQMNGMDTAENSFESEIAVDGENFPRCTDCDRVAEISFTSGTTGTSKGVMLTHRNIASDAYYTSMAIEIADSDVGFSVLPLSHMLEICSNIMCGIYFGRTVYLNDNLKNIIRNMKLFKPSVMVVVPLVMETAYKTIERQAKQKKKYLAFKLGLFITQLMSKIGIDTSNLFFREIKDNFGGKLHTFICGGAFLDSRLIRAFKCFGIKVIEGYGITECSPVVSVNCDNWSKKGSVGKVIGCNEVKIVNGEIWVRGSNVMKGYLNSEGTYGAGLEEDGWLNTGDLGTVDEDGFVYLRGRKKNLIILSNGENVCPEELELKLSSVSGIEDVAVYEKDKMIFAEIYPDAVYREMEKDKAKAHFDSAISTVNSKLPPFKRIGDYKIRDREFQKTVTQKIKRNVLGGEDNG